MTTKAQEIIKALKLNSHKRPIARISGEKKFLPTKDLESILPKFGWQPKDLLQNPLMMENGNSYTFSVNKTADVPGLNVIYNNNKEVKHSGMYKAQHRS